MPLSTYFTLSGLIYIVTDFCHFIENTVRLIIAGNYLVLYVGRKSHDAVAGIMALSVSLMVFIRLSG